MNLTILEILLAVEDWVLRGVVGLLHHWRLPLNGGRLVLCRFLFCFCFCFEWELFVFVCYLISVLFWCVFDLDCVVEMREREGGKEGEGGGFNCWFGSGFWCWTACGRRRERKKKC